jgi:Ca-activated chloride channel family protein
MPLDPGSYEVRYVMRQDRTVLAAQPLEVVEVRAGIEAVSEAPAGSLVVVDWEGPGYEGDYIDVAAPGAGDGDYVNYTYAREGSPMLIRLPITPGDYELRYIATGDGRSVLARHAVTATPVNAEIDAPEAAPAGANVAIRWEGPDYEGDYIALFKAGEEDDRSYRYTAKDSPMVMTMPEGPGRYELRYITGQGRQVLATHGIELTYEPE